jgi:hypothetical protein
LSKEKRERHWICVPKYLEKFGSSKEALLRSSSERVMSLISSEDPASNPSAIAIHSQVASYGCWTNILGGNKSSYSVYLNAWATHTTGELRVFSDETMAHALAIFPLGQLSDSIIINENVICLKTNKDTCTFLCESKQQQINWLKVLRFPLLSPLPINNSKGWQWENFNGPQEENNESDVESQLKMKRLLLDAKAQTDLQEIQDKNRKMMKEKEERELKQTKMKELHRNQALKRRKERLEKEGRTDELNWTKSTKNVYKTLGVEPPKIISLTPSLYKQQLTNTETPQERTSRLSREKAAAHRAMREQMKKQVSLQTENVAMERRKYKQRKGNGGSGLFEGSTVSDLSQYSTHVQEMVNRNPINYRHALVHSHCGEDQVKACVIIQKMWRGHMCRNIHNMLRKYFAAVLIQKSWLLFKFKCAMKLNLRRLLDNKKELARCYKEHNQHKLKVDAAEAKLKKKSHEKARLVSCITIQRAIRAALVRRGKHIPLKSLTLSPTHKSREKNHRHYHGHSSSDNHLHQSDVSLDSSSKDDTKRNKKKDKSKKDKLKKEKPKKEKSKKKDRAYSGEFSGNMPSIHEQHANSESGNTDDYKPIPKPHSRYSDISTPHLLSPNKLSVVNSSDIRRRDIHNAERIGSFSSNNNLTGNGRENDVEEGDAEENFDNKPNETNSKGNKKFKNAVRDVIIQQNVILDIFGIEESHPDYTDIVIKRQPPSPPKTVHPPLHPSPSSLRKGRSFHRLLTS